MKKLSALRKVTAFLGLIGFIALCSVMVRCKRELSMDQPKSKADIPVDMMNLIRKKGKGFQMPIGISVPVNIVDNEGRIISSQDMNKPYGDCPDICEDPSCVVPEPSVLDHILSWQKVCGDNYEISVSWTVRTPFTLTDLNPFNSAQFSKGRIKLKNSSGTVIFQDLAIPITSLGISLLGTDPADPDMNIYQVNYTRQNINRYFFDASTPSQDKAVTFEASYFIYTDCAYDFPFALSTAYNVPVNLLYAHGNLFGPAICDRVDYAYITTTSGVPGYNGTIAGTDVIGDCDEHGDLLNTGSYIQYRKQGQSTWRQLKMYNSSGISRNDGIIFISELFFIKTTDFILDNSSSGGTGNYEFRYRNTDENPDVCTSAPWSSIETHTF